MDCSAQLPVKIDIIKHRSEIDGKSTAAHAAVLAPQDVRVFEYPNIPDYRLDGNGVVLIYPCPGSTDVRGLFDGIRRLDGTVDNFGFEPGQLIGTLLKQKMQEINDEDDDAVLVDGTRYDLTNLPVRRAVFIDSTWNQSRGIYKDPKVGGLPCVVLQNRLSQFWRHQKGSPRWYLSTVEAIHQFVLEVHARAWGISNGYRGLDGLEISNDFIAKSLVEVGEQPVGGGDAADAEQERSLPYCGQYDNLLFFFTHMYGLIHTYYDHNKLKAYKRPIT